MKIDLARYIRYTEKVQYLSITPEAAAVMYGNIKFGEEAEPHEDHPRLVYKPTLSLDLDRKYTNKVQEVGLTNDVSDEDNNSEAAFYRVALCVNELKGNPEYISAYNKVSQLPEDWDKKKDWVKNLFSHDIAPILQAVFEGTVLMETDSKN